ncbi:DUF4019 domain-containing protein [Ramlibacter pallidus]|uniref:DUF4019 domain-containing protein n=1 Tax=Ramlibacter pallidus TaxID=2780087 RepID=A0ABR9SAL7_9BURK|nr:DUF4019 domain-containing protein [Ramlibacter pallidus]MBE7370007.1 DUF4019 domain-containing protein [Ramlibacter pallidus]
MKPSSRLTLLATLACAALTAQAQLKPSAPGATGTQRPAAAAAPAAAPAPGNPEFEKAGQNAAHAWLLLLDRKDWGTAWDASSAVFRQSVPLGTWMDNVPKLREPFGAFVERQPAEVGYRKQLAGRPDGDYVTAIFVTKFDKKAEVVETVTTVREADGRWRVTGYTAR